MNLGIQDVSCQILMWVVDLCTIDYPAKRPCEIILYEKIAFHYLEDWVERLRVASSN